MPEFIVVTDAGLDFGLCLRIFKAFSKAHDFITQGGTLADLRGYIEGKGGKVLLATTLQSRPGNRGLKPTREQLAQLRALAPDIDELW